LDNKIPECWNVLPGKRDTRCKWWNTWLVTNVVTVPTVQSTLKLADETHFSLSANVWFFVIFNSNVVFNFFHFFGSTIGRAAFAFQTTGKKRFNNFNGDDMICVIFFFVMVIIVRQIRIFRVTFKIIGCRSFLGTTKTHNSVFDTHDDQTCTVSQQSRLQRTVLPRLFLSCYWHRNLLP
jgi:hypothetical protein